MSNVLSYAKLMSEQNSLEAIREGARVICERRGRYADTISNDVERIKSEISVIETLIETIEDNSSVLDSNQKSDLKTLCKNLKESLKAYLQKAQSLCTRFNNKKIKVLAFGLKSEGKSTFTRRYTGLPESVVAVKGTGVEQDKTGALSIIYHDINYTKDDPKIIVHFKTQMEILTVVNFCVKKLAVLPNFKLPNCTDSGYSTWDDLESVLNDNSKKCEAFQTLASLTDKDEKVIDFTSLKSFLISVFEKESNFTDVDKNSHFKDVDLSELPLYNDMTNEGERRYLSVDRIEIFANLGYEGIFENFEICDTKGISAKAGGAMIVEQGLYNDINNSDAVFSIKKTGQSVGAQEFYERLSNNIKKCVEGVKPENLHTKHFAILNLIANAEKDPKTIDDTIKTINDLNLAKCIYIGSLGDNILYESKTIDADWFAKLVIVDMLSKIIDSTKESDDLLIKSCNELVIKINNNQQLLNKFLLQLQDKGKEKNIENILLEKIESYRISAINELKEEAKSQRISLSDVMGLTDSDMMNSQSDSYDSYENDDDDYDDYDDDDSNNVSSHSKTSIAKEKLKNEVSTKDPKQDLRVFEMITAKSGEGIIKSNKLSATKQAIDYILDNKVKGKAGSNVLMNARKVDGTVSSLGGYIDSVSSLLYGELDKNINELYSPAHSIDSIVDFRKNIFQVVWKTLKLNALIGELDEKTSVDNIGNNVINKWYKFYNEPIKDHPCSVIIPQQSYNILIAYFKGLHFDMNSNLKTTEPIIDWDKLKEAIQEVYSVYDFEGRILEKLANEELLKHNVIRSMFASLTNPNFVADIHGVYLGRDPKKLLEANIIEQTEYDRIDARKKWEMLRNTREQLSTKSVTSLQNIQ